MIFFFKNAFIFLSFKFTIVCAYNAEVKSISKFIISCKFAAKLSCVAQIHSIKAIVAEVWCNKLFSIKSIIRRSRRIGRISPYGAMPFRSVCFQQTYNFQFKIKYKDFFLYYTTKDFIAYINKCITWRSGFLTVQD